MAVAALVLPDRLDKPSLVLAGQPETEVRERRRRSLLPPCLAQGRRGPPRSLRAPVMKSAVLPL